MKPPIWKTSKDQSVRVLRYHEAKTLIANISNESDLQQWNMKTEASESTVRTWVMALLFTGCRVSELIKIHEHPELLQSDGTYLASRNIFYDSGKKKQIAQERVIYFSDMGIPIIKRFFDTERIADTQEHVNSVLNALLRTSALISGFEQREFTFIENGISGKRLTTGVSVRSFRKTWDSWLVNSFHSDPFALMIAEKSMGHSMATAMKHYLTMQYDEEDMADIRKATKGFGLHPDKTATVEPTAENTPS
jgi:integrase